MSIRLLFGTVSDDFVVCYKRSKPSHPSRPLADLGGCPRKRRHGSPRIERLAVDLIPPTDDFDLFTDHADTHSDSQAGQTSIGPNIVDRLCQNCVVPQLGHVRLHAIIDHLRVILDGCSDAAARTGPDICSRFVHEGIAIVTH